MHRMYRMHRMHRLVRLFPLLLVLVAGSALAQDEGAAETSPNPHVVIKTSKGDVVLELFADKAPKTVENFLTYVRDGHYDGTIVYRVNHFLIQAGSTTPDLVRREVREPIENEADNGLVNERGTIGMARWGPHTANAEYYVNTRRNPHLDHRDKSEQGWGYCVFGRVIQGMSVVDAIAAIPTHVRGNLQELPQEEVLIETVTIAPADAKFEAEDVGEPPPAAGAGRMMKPAEGKSLTKVKSLKKVD